MTFGMNTCVTKLLYIDIYVFCMKKITLFFFWYFKYKKNRTKATDNINLNNIYISSRSAESSHDVFTNLSQHSIFAKSADLVQVHCRGHSVCKVVIVVDNSVVCDRTADNKSGGQLIREKCYMWREHRKLDFVQIYSELSDVFTVLGHGILFPFDFIIKTTMSYAWIFLCFEYDNFKDDIAQEKVQIRQIYTLSQKWQSLKQEGQSLYYNFWAN